MLPCFTASLLRPSSLLSCRHRPYVLCPRSTTTYPSSGPRDCLLRTPRAPVTRHKVPLQHSHLPFGPLGSQGSSPSTITITITTLQPIHPFLRFTAVPHLPRIALLTLIPLIPLLRPLGASFIQIRRLATLRERRPCLCLCICAFVPFGNVPFVATFTFLALLRVSLATCIKYIDE